MILLLVLPFVEAVQIAETITADRRDDKGLTELILHLFEPMFRFRYTLASCLLGCPRLSISWAIHRHLQHQIVCYLLLVDVMRPKSFACKDPDSICSMDNMFDQFLFFSRNDFSLNSFSSKFRSGFDCAFG